MRIVLGPEDEEQWMDSEIPAFAGDVQWLIRPLTQSTLRVIKAKASRNPLARRHQMDDDIEGKPIKVDGNEIDALQDEIADYVLANWRGVLDRDGNELDINDVLTDARGRQISVKKRLLDNLDIVAEVVGFGRKLGGAEAVQESRKN